MAKPEVRIQVEDLDKLLTLTEAQLKVWLYYKRRMGADGRAWGKAQTIATACGLEAGTIRNARAWLTKRGWLVRRMEEGKPLPLFTAVIPKLHLETKDCHSTVTPLSFEDDTGVISGLQQVSFESETQVVTMKEQPEEATLKDSALRAVSQSVGQLATQPSAGLSPTLPKDPIALEAEEIQRAANEILYTERLWLYLGKPYMSVDDVPHAIRIAHSLVRNRRSVQWLVDMVTWMKSNTFWKKRLHAGERSMKQLANHIETEEVIAQFEQHLAIDLGIESLSEKSAYVQNWYDESEPEHSSLGMSDSRTLLREVKAAHGD